MTQNFSMSNITTYGALVIPYDLKEIEEQANLQNDPKTINSFKGKLRSALNLSPNKNLLGASLLHPATTFTTLGKYMYDNRKEISGLMTTIGSKFSGIAVAQALVNGKVTSKEALDYLFMGFAPALGVTGSLFGYSGLNQMKDALANGTVDVGAFVSGFTRTLKGITDIKDMLFKKDGQTSANIIEFDLTISHSETYQSETPDRRVQSGQSLNEYVHNMPDVSELQCALQDGKRYSIPEFRAILTNVRNKKEVVAIVLGEEYFDNLILTDFSPTNDCSKSGMDYTLSFKKVTRSDIDTNTEVVLQQAPELLNDSDKISSSGGLGGNTKDLGNTKFDLAQIEKETGISITPQIDKDGSIKSMANALMGESGNY